MKNTTYYILFLFVTVFCYSQDKQLLQTGVIIDSVKITTTPTESYAIYLPKKYDAKTRSTKCSQLLRRSFPISYQFQ
ncbi:hypothetical protein OIU83_20050 [Flavobacterium sp. LS1R49]|uniref:Uncharacterized protein n=1 Tax=Flavobacterium shii TaxID=2987687 RepID=A0A9X2ZF41_9FLAO|nr:hypothetical protein [Flavobacterium shii]MCV9929964.1 hypothetical protein [Flavobacterium shii]